MMNKSAKSGEWVSHNKLIGSVSWGINQPKIFLRICQIYRDLGLDILDVESHVREGWFSKTIIARNTNEGGFDLNKLKRGVAKVSRELEFRSEIFSVPDSARTSDREANVTIVIQAMNKTGLLAEILEILDQFNIDIIDINILMDNEEKRFALNLQVFIPIEEEGFFSDLEKLRKQLHNFRRQPGLENFNYLVHSSETFNFIEKIDYESEVLTNDA